MSLVKLYYTLPEAVRAFRACLPPGEAAKDQLIAALHAGKVDSEIVCSETGQTYPVPRQVWKSTDKRFTVNFRTGIGEIEKRLVTQGPTRPIMGGWRGREYDPVTREILPDRIKGEIQISRPQLDALLDSAKPPDSEPAERKPGTDAIAECDNDALPNFADRKQNWAKQQSTLMSSDKTLNYKRAAELIAKMLENDGVDVATIERECRNIRHEAGQKRGK